MRKWTIAEARRQLAEVVRSAAREPQRIYRRDRLVATVVSPERAGEEPSLADAFAELRGILGEEAYVVQVPKRRDRPNPFARRRR